MTSSLRQSEPKKQLRIFHSPRNVANQATIAVEALRERGHYAESWDFGDNPFGFKADKLLSADISFEERWQLFNESVEKFDIFHFHFGNTFFPSYPQMLPLWDLPVLKALGKKVFMHFHGTDIRMPSIYKKVNPYAEHLLKNSENIDETWLKDRLALFNNFCDAIFVSSYDLLDFAPMAKVVPRAIDVRIWDYKPAPQNRPLKIIHTPSKGGARFGSDLVIKGMEELKKQGLEFDFVLIENVAHKELKKEIENADIVIDRLLTGECGLVSFEAMTAGTIPVAYISPEVAKHQPELPVYNVSPENFVERMSKLLQDREYIRRLARSCRDYAIAHHSKQVLGAHLEKHYLETEIKPFNKTQIEWVSRNMDQSKKSLTKKLNSLSMELETYKAYESSFLFKIHKNISKILGSSK